MKLLKVVFAIEFMLGLTFLLVNRLGTIPALGNLLNPVTGFWLNAESRSLKKDLQIHIDGLKDQVTVRYDRDMIPHIFASNDYDLSFAQGYVTARERLWQMDLQVRTAAGRLAEVLGPDLFGQDRYYRRIGLAVSADSSLQLMMKDSSMRNILDGYSDGVNAYIDHLSPADYPIEFKLLDYTPERWQPLNCLLIYKLMAATLSSGSAPFQMSAVLKQLGPVVTQELFPDQRSISAPIIPEHTPWNFMPLNIPAPPSEPLAMNRNTYDLRPRPDGIGSNNWVIAATRSKNGHPLLANDPHLDLSLPSTWYQIQMISPDLNVYGVSIPGIPCIIIGYNKHIAWGLTNSGADVQDWYRERFKDSTRNEYWYGNKWNPVDKRIEKIRIRGRKTVYDTISYTCHGPVLRRGGSGDASDDEPFTTSYSLRWIALDGSEDIKTFYLLDRAVNFNDYQKSLQYFSSPAQNFIFASNDKDIAITAAGKYPLRYKDQGKFVLDGTSQSDDWHGWIPHDQDPMAKNPAQGFLSSANQAPADSSYPYYLSWEFGPADRAKRINDLLSGMHQASVDSFRAMQNDTYSVLAAEVLPNLLGYLADSTQKRYQSELQQLTNWNYRYDASSIGATMFDRWWNILYERIWSDEFDKKNIHLRWPSRDRTEKLLLDAKDAVWFDDTRTPEKETKKQIVNQAFSTAMDSLVSQLGQPGKSWRWGSFRKCRISHLGGIDVFGLGPFEAGGASNTIDALTKSLGPSWRMVVDLGPEVKGYGIFPGGESGNPGSYYYDNLFQTWKEGKLKELTFMLSKEESPDSVLFTLKLN